MSVVNVKLVTAIDDPRPQVDRGHIGEWASDPLSPRRSPPMTAELTRRDIFLARGWVECRECGGEGVFQCQHWNHIAGDMSNGCKPDRFCAACVDGLVPPSHKVESIARAEALGRKKLTEHQVRTVLIEDARRMKP